MLAPQGMVDSGFRAAGAPADLPTYGIGSNEHQHRDITAADVDSTSKTGAAATRATIDSAKSITEWRTAPDSAAQTPHQQSTQQQRSWTLFYSVSSELLSAAAKQLQPRAKTQKFSSMVQPLVGQESALAPQQQQQDSEASAARAVADGSKAKPWQRVSSAISLLQQGITQRRLEAAYAEAAGPAATAGAAVNGDTPVATGPNGLLLPVAAAAAAAESSESGQGSSEATGRLSASQRSGSLPQLQMLDMIGRGTFAR